MNKFKQYWIDLPAEEKANTLTHLFPLVATFAIVVPLIRLAWQAQMAQPGLQLLGATLFLVGMVLMYASSTLYHLVVAPVHKARLRIFDHISIYVMIAGSYSPICLSVVRGWLGWSVFIFLWACVIAGIVGKLVALGKHPRLSLTLYLAMGWVALLMIVPMWRNMPHAAFLWVFAEGIFYTIGAYFFNLDEQRPFYHAIWHVFIVLGSLSHTIATWLMLTPLS
jgi:hemolysin III